MFAWIGLKWSLHSEFTFTSLLNLCSDMRLLDFGEEVRQRLQDYRAFVGPKDSTDVFVTNSALIKFDAACHGLASALKTFREMRESGWATNVVTWNVVLGLCAEHDNINEAVSLYEEMRKNDIEPDEVTYLTILELCLRIGSIEYGKDIVRHILDTGIKIKNFRLAEVIVKFDDLSRGESTSSAETPRLKDIATWNAKLLTLSRDKRVEEAIQFYEEMKRSVKPDDKTYVILLSMCTINQAYDFGEKIYSDILESEWADLRRFTLVNALVNFFGHSRGLDSALDFFARIRENNVAINVVTWNTLLTIAKKEHRVSDVLRLFEEMVRSGVEPDGTTYVLLLRLYAAEQFFDLGRKLIENLQTLPGLKLRDEPSVVGAIIAFTARAEGNTAAIELFRKLRERTKFPVTTWTLFFLECFDENSVEEAIEHFEEMVRAGVRPDEKCYATLLTLCAKSGAKEGAEKVFRHLKANNLPIAKNPKLLASAIQALAKCFGLSSAVEQLRKSSEKTTVPVEVWNATMFLCSEGGNLEYATQLFEDMKKNGAVPDQWSYVSLMKACSAKGDTNAAKEIRSLLQASPFGDLKQPVIVNALLDMYRKCSGIGSQLDLLNEIDRSNLDDVSWSIILLSCADSNNLDLSMRVFSEMESAGVTPNVVAYVAMFTLCANCHSLSHGEKIYSHLRTHNPQFMNNVKIGTSLVNMYGKCEGIDSALNLFHGFRDRGAKINVVAWNTLFGLCAKFKEVQKATQLFGQMLSEDIKPDPITFVNLFTLCSTTKSLNFGKDVHAQLKKLPPSQYLTNLPLLTSLLTMYGSCADIQTVNEVYKSLREQGCRVELRDVLIKEYANRNNLDAAMKLFDQMKKERIEPSEYSYSSLLAACARKYSWDHGNHVSSLIPPRFLESKEVRTALINLRGKLDGLHSALELFEEIRQKDFKIDVSTWNSLISMCADELQANAAMTLFQEMEEYGVLPDTVTYISMFNVLAATRSKKYVRTIYEHLLSSPWISLDDSVLVNSILTARGKCEGAEAAFELLDELIQRGAKTDIITWNVLASLCHDSSRVDLASVLFQRIKEQIVQPGLPTFTSLLKLCSMTGSFSLGREIHEHLESALVHYQDSETLMSLLVKMYGKWGNLEAVEDVFDSFEKKRYKQPTALMSTLVNAYLANGSFYHALHHYHAISNPNLELSNSGDCTMALFISLCAHLGMTSEAIELYHSLQDFGVEPDYAHHNGAIYALTKAGRPEEAEEILQAVETNTIVDVFPLVTLLEGYKAKNDLEKFAEIANRIVAIDPSNTVVHLQAVNVYSGRDEAQEAFWRQKIEKLGVNE